jgi:hypothetical protein
MGDVVRELIMRLFGERKHYGLYSEVARHVGVSSQAAREWAIGMTVPSEQYWPALETFFELEEGQIRKTVLDAGGIIRNGNALAPLGTDVSAAVDKLAAISAELQKINRAVAALAVETTGMRSELDELHTVQERLRRELQRRQRGSRDMPLGDHPESRE